MLITSPLYLAYRSRGRTSLPPLALPLAPPLPSHRSRGRTSLAPPLSSHSPVRNKLHVVQYKSRFDDDTDDLTSSNPQNSPEPLIRPLIELSAIECVKAQIDTAQEWDKPFQNHCVVVFYNFSRDAGSMERSQYFGYSKDLYHLDHFLGAFRTTFQSFLTANSFEYRQVESETPDEAVVLALATPRSSPTSSSDSNNSSSSDRKQQKTLKFTLCRGEYGSRTGCWLVKSLILL